MYCIICEEEFVNQTKHINSEEHKYNLIYYPTWLLFKDIYDINLRYEVKNFDILKIHDIIHKKKKRP